MADRETERRKYKKTAAKFAKLAALDAAGATKERRAMSNTWTRRGGKNVTGFWRDPK